MDFARNNIKETSKNSGDPIIQDAIRHVTNDDSIKKQLMKFVSDIFITQQFPTNISIRPGMEGLLLSAMSSPKLIERVRGFYCLSGTSEKIREDIKWLLTDSKFMYSDINVEV